jgi:hypothetical protein
MLSNSMFRAAFGVSLMGVLASGAFAQFTETEANDSKATANVFNTSAAGFTITGNSTGSSTTTARFDFGRLLPD